MNKLIIFKKLQEFVKIQETKCASDNVYKRMHSAMIRKLQDEQKILILITEDGDCFYKGSVHRILDDFIMSNKSLSPSSICLDFQKLFGVVHSKSGAKRKREKIESTQTILSKTETSAMSNLRNN